MPIPFYLVLMSWLILNLALLCWLVRPDEEEKRERAMQRRTLTPDFRKPRGDG